MVNTQHTQKAGSQFMLVGCASADPWKTSRIKVL